jgi:hypothetical protein
MRSAGPSPLRTSAHLSARRRRIAPHTSHIDYRPSAPGPALLLAPKLREPSAANLGTLNSKRPLGLRSAAAHAPDARVIQPRGSGLARRRGPPRPRVRGAAAGVRRPAAGGTRRRLGGPLAGGRRRPDGPIARACHGDVHRVAPVRRRHQRAGAQPAAAGRRGAARADRACARGAQRLCQRGPRRRQDDGRAAGGGRLPGLSVCGHHVQSGPEGGHAAQGEGHRREERARHQLPLPLHRALRRGGRLHRRGHPEGGAGCGRAAALGGAVA